MSENTCARARDVVEEWTLLSTLPPRDVLVVRAEYSPEGSRCLALPAVLEGRAELTARVVGNQGARLEVAHTTGASIVQIPAALAAERSVRLELRSGGSVGPVRWFRAAWPELGRDAREPRRRTVSAPPEFAPKAPQSWTCQAPPDESGAPVGVFCVSTDPAPPPLALHFHAERPARLTLGFSIAFALVALAASVRLAGAPYARALPGALGGAFAGGALGFALVAAQTVRPLVVLLAIVPVFTALGALASQRPVSRTVGAVGLLVVSCLALLNGRVGPTLAASASAVLALVCARALEHGQPAD